MTKNKLEFTDYVPKSQLYQCMIEAEEKAWNSLASYKFMMFGYWVAVWVHLRKAYGQSMKNPFSKLVKMAQEHIDQKNLGVNINGKH